MEQDREAIISFSTVDDGVEEGPEVLRVSLDSPSGAALGSPDEVSVTTTELNVAPRLSLTILQNGEPGPLSTPIKERLLSSKR